MSLIVQKFGGTSVADAHHLFNVAKKITDLYSKNNDVVVVVSAQGDTTDDLLKKAYQVNSTPPPREMDAFLSAGEQMSAALLAMAIKKLGFPAVSLTGWQAGFQTDLNHGNAEIKNITTERIKKELKKKNIVIIAGFQGINENEDITTLGRGGSDTSAVAVCAYLNADICKIYTDVDGVYTADPRIVPSAKKLESISYEEMFEMSCLGAQVLNDRSISTAKKYGVEVEVLSSMSNKESGTVVKNIYKKSIHNIAGIAALNNIVKITVSDIENAKIFQNKIIDELKKSEITVDDLLTPIGPLSKNNLVFTVFENQLEKTLEILEKLLENKKNQIYYEKNKSKISVVNMEENININIASIVFETLSESEINIEMVACNNERVSIIVESTNMHSALNIIHSKLFEEDNLL